MAGSNKVRQEISNDYQEQNMFLHEWFNMWMMSVYLPKVIIVPFLIIEQQ